MAIESAAPEKTTTAQDVAGELTLDPGPEECPETIAALFLNSVQRYGSLPAIRRKVNGRYEPLTYQQLYEEVCAAARGFRALGLKAGDRLAIISENRPEWVYCDMACQLSGIVTVPIYPTLPSNQVEYILRDAQCRAIVVSDSNQLKKVVNAWGVLSELRAAVVMDPLSDTNGQTHPPDRRVLSLDTLRAEGADALAETAIREMAGRVSPDDLSSIVYTSGTTGDPKGAMLTHGNFASNANSISRIIELHTSDVFLSFLPLNHVFERLAGYFFPLQHGASVAYAESALRVKQNLPEVMPTVMIGVPRLYDGLAEGVQTSVSKAPARAQKLFHWATAVGKKRAAALEAGRSPGPLTAVLWSAADRLVLQKIRAKMGCGRLRYFVSGSAPLPRSTAEFLLSLGFGVLEGWGLTETSPVLTVNKPGDFRVGSVGLPIPGVEVKTTEDGELISRGPNTMRGYLNKPDATAEAIDDSGWFHTGDVGHIDADGFVYITDRKKDLLVLATGKKVAPQPIESRLAASPFIREVVVLGDRMSACIALIVPDPDRLTAKGRADGWTFDDQATLYALPDARKFIRSEIDRLSVGLADYEKIRQFALLDTQFTVEGGELTPTLKVKRRVVAEKYAAVIASLSG
ncbi:MAG: long-chain fatty acid--CoA ligase [Chloroflexi bacterium]|nr:long-chain fatty acid--CoA ligase [Chloroflexota bacterium]